MACRGIQTSSYQTPEAILSNACTYEISTATTNHNRGLKTESDFYVQSPSDHTAFALDHSELYGYDSARDFLNSASYNGGATNTTWSYDAAGNRNDATAVDNLNRATSISSVNRSYDVLGNTTSIGTTKSMGWDVLNRMTSCTSGGATTSYAYRLDGMRVSKNAGSQTSNYAYGGQTEVEESFADSANSSNNYTQRFGIGCRGVERIETTSSSGVQVAYPIYDAHGNMITTLSKSSGSYTYTTCRLYDSWGNIISGSSTGVPLTRYCANLGHVQDDESGLVYMRSRYYDPNVGRFVSQDPKWSESNGFVYASNDPTDCADASGKETGNCTEMVVCAGESCNLDFMAGEVEIEGEIFPLYNCTANIEGDELV